MKHEKHRTHNVRIWDHDHSETLRGCFDCQCTDWQVFYDGCSDNDDEIADTVTSYIQFFIQTKTVRIFPNNKPWITKEQKGILNEKKHVFLNGDCTSV